VLAPAKLCAPSMYWPSGVSRLPPMPLNKVTPPLTQIRPLPNSVGGFSKLRALPLSV
jgi:hypothetical protein